MCLWFGGGFDGALRGFGDLVLLLVIYDVGCVLGLCVLVLWKFEFCLLVLLGFAVL